MLVVPLLLGAAAPGGIGHIKLIETQPPEAAIPAAFTTLDLTQGLTPEDLVSALLGPDMSVSNVVYVGAEVAAGSFTGGTGIIGFDSGVILSSGCIANIAGPNVLDDISCDNLLPGDAALSFLSGYDTHDATVLEFDFVPEDPDATVLLFSYVFASDEYNEWVYTPFNDVFAFWVNGQNCALVPGPTGVSSPVTIDTVNGGNPFANGNETNPVLYLNNDLSDGGGAIDSEMDGLTVTLSCQAEIIPEETNHIRLAIADSSDGVYDSNVMLLAGSFTPTDLVVTLVPPTAANPVGTTHTVTATVLDGSGVGQPGLHVDFTVLSGPNAGAMGTCTVDEECVTDAGGHVSFTYLGGPNEGTDIIRACIDDVGGNDNCSPAVVKHWALDCGLDGTPCGGMPAACEIQRTCLDGVCQDNGLEPPTTECRPATGDCDWAEFCTGSNPDCPLDQHMPDDTLCMDGDSCTEDDRCQAGSCVGDLIDMPEEVDDGVRIMILDNAPSLTWNMPPGTIASDILRGLVAGLPVGPGGDDETCIGEDELGTTFRIVADPAPGTGYWYLIRGVNDCGHGPYGYEAELGVPTVPRESTTCP
jgi:hypothetical protein